jgi:hypothetical protein
VATGVTTIRWGNRQTVVVIDVAQIAGHVRMPVCQQESSRAVVENSGRPTDGCVARRAVRKCKRSPSRGMYGICGLLLGRQVAAGISAIGRRDGQVIVIIYVTESAGDIRVAIGQCESGRAVVKLRVQPAVERMARGAIPNRKLRSGRLVHRIRGLLPILQMTGQACRR